MAKAKPVTESTALLLVGAGRALERRIEAALAGLGLSLRLLGALGHLAASPELSYSDLARRARVTPQSMRATVAQLEDLGAVRVDGAGQGVAAKLEVTARGVELLEQARLAVARIDEEHLGRLPAGAAAALRETTVRLLGIEGGSPAARRAP